MLNMTWKILILFDCFSQFCRDIIFQTFRIYKLLQHKKHAIEEDGTHRFRYTGAGILLLNNRLA